MELFFVLKVFLAFLMLGCSVEQANGLYANGVNVCSYQVRQTQPYQAAIAYTAYERYRACCGHWLFCWRPCTKTRSVTRYRLETRYRTFYVTRHTCCNGWMQGAGSNECRVAVCNSPACLHGRCIRPNTCTCNTGYIGPSTGCRTDKDECAVVNGGCQQQCNNYPGGYSCSCRRGFTVYNSHHCRDNNECAVSQGICRCDDAANNPSCNATCYNTIGSFMCSCSAGYHVVAFTRCVDKNECLFNNGGCDHYCSNLPGSHRCSCRVGFTLDSNGTSCNDVDECKVNNGGCEVLCINKIGSYECRCSRGHILDSNGKTCSDVDECATIAHGCQQRCNNYKGGYFCSCNNGFKLNADNKTCSDINECNIIKTGPGGSNSTLAGCTQLCHNSIGSFSCSCRTGFLLQHDGKTCHDVNECSGNHGCQHTCVNTVGSYSCKCQRGFRLNSNGRSCDGLPCIRLPPIINGNGTCFTGKTNETCQLGCFVGFSLRGSSERRCLPNHKWSGSLTTCQRKECASLEPPVNGAIQLPCMSYYQASCTVKCNQGYYATGPTGRTCRATANNRMYWNNADTICKKITVCSPNPCKHKGACQVVSKTEYKCNCRNTGYKGMTCETGIIGLPEYPIMQLHNQYKVVITAKPEKQLILELSSKTAGLTLTPSNLVFTTEVNSLSVSLSSRQPGLHVIHYSISGTDASTFEKPKQSVVYVKEPKSGNSSFVENVINEQGAFIQGCYDSNKFNGQETETKVPKPVKWYSDAPWNEATEYEWTDGVVVMAIEGNIMPASVVGSNVSTEKIMNNDFDSFIQKYSVDDLVSTTKPTSTENKAIKCVSKNPSTKYLTEMVELNSFPKSVVDAVNERTPFWFNLFADLSIKEFVLSDFVANVHRESKLKQLFPECSQLMGSRIASREWYSYTTNQMMKMHMAEEELELPSGKQVCVFKSIDNKDTFIGFPQSEKSSTELKDSTGWSGKVKSVKFRNETQNSTYEISGKFSTESLFKTSKININVEGNIHFTMAENSKLASEGISSFLTTKAAGFISLGIKSNSAYSTEEFSVSGDGVVSIQHKGDHPKSCPWTNYIVDISSVRKSMVSERLKSIIKVDAGARTSVKFAADESGGKIMDAQNLTEFLNIERNIKELNRTVSYISAREFPRGNFSSVVGDVRKAVGLSDELTELCKLNSGPKLLPTLIDLKRTISVIERKFQVLAVVLRDKESFEQFYQSVQNSINATYSALKVSLKRESVSRKIGSYFFNSHGTICLGDLCFPNSSFNIVYGLSKLQLQTCYDVDKKHEAESVIIGMTGEEKTLAGVLKIPRNTKVLYMSSKGRFDVGMFNATVSIYGSERTVEVKVQNNTLNFSAGVLLPDKSTAEFNFTAGLFNLKSDGDVLIKVRGYLGQNSDLIKQINAYLQKRLAQISNVTHTRVDALRKAVDRSSKQQRDAAKYLHEVEQNYADKLAEELRISREVNVTRITYKSLKSTLQKRLKKYDSVIANYTLAIEKCAPRICVSKCTPGIVKSICYDDRYVFINIKSCNLVTKNYAKTELQQISSPASYVAYDTKTSCQTKCPPLTGFFRKLFGRKRRGLVATLAKQLIITVTKSAGKSLFGYLGGETGKIGAQIGSMLPGPFGIVGMIVGGIIGSAFGACDKICTAEYIPKLVHFTKYDVEKFTRTVHYKESVCKDTIKEMKSGFNHAYECLQQRNCSESLADVRCLHENERCYASRNFLRQRISDEMHLLPVYNSFAAQSLKLEGLETAKRFATADRENAYQSLLSAKSLSLEANYTLDLAKQSLASTNALFSLEIKAAKEVAMYGARSYYVRNGRCLFYTTKGSKIPMSLALDMELEEGNGKRLASTSIIDFSNINKTVADATKDIINNMFGKSQRSRRSLNSDDLAETLTVDGLNLNVTRKKCSVIEKNLFYLLKVLNHFVKGLRHHDNTTKEIEIAEEKRLTFTRSIETKINGSGLCSDNGSITTENCSTTWLTGMYKNMTGGATEKNLTLSWHVKRIQIISNLEIYTKSQNFTNCGGVRDCVHASIKAISELVKFEKSHLAILCREAIPVWVSSFNHLLDGESVTLNNTRKHVQIIWDSITASRPTDIFCDSPPIIINDLPAKVVITISKSAILNFTLVQSIHSTSFVWKKDGATISSSGDKTLMITGTDKSMDGYYNCEITNKFGKISTRTVHVIYEEIPIIIQHPKNTKTTIKSPSSLLTLVCNATGEPKPEISWLFAPFSNISDLTTLTQYGSVLQLNSTSGNQSGFYHCKASNTQGYAISQPARVHVLQSIIAEFAIKVSFYFYPQATNSSQNNKSGVSTPLSLSKEEQTNLTSILSKHMNITTSRINNMYYTKISNQSALLSFDIKTQDLSKLLRETSDWTTISEDIVMARKGLLVLSVWLHYVFNNITTEIAIGDSNYTVDAETIDADPLAAKCPFGYSLMPNGFICEKCQSGSRYIAGDGCKLCPVGFYQPKQGQSECMKCGDDMVTQYPGSVYSGDCFSAVTTTAKPETSAPMAISTISTTETTTRGTEAVITSEVTTKTETVITSEVKSKTEPTKHPSITSDRVTTSLLGRPVAKPQEEDKKLGIIIGLSLVAAVLVILIIGFTYRKYAGKVKEKKPARNVPERHYFQKKPYEDGRDVVFKNTTYGQLEETRTPKSPDVKSQLVSKDVTVSQWKTSEGLAFQNQAYGSFGDRYVEDNNTVSRDLPQFELNEFPRFKNPGPYPYQDLGVEVMPYRPRKDNSSC